MDAFFASVEVLRRHELKGKPVVVGGDGDPTKRGVVSTASYEARRFGIRSAMPLRVAYSLCPDAVFLPVDMEEYSRVSGIIKKILHEFSPTLEDVGIDEAFLDISDTPETSEDIAGKIKTRILSETSLTCSIGIGPNKLVSKIASDMRKPDGLTIVESREVEEFLSLLPVRRLYGVGPKTEAHLKDIGITTICQLRERPLAELIGHFGDSYGRYLYEASKGRDESPLVTEWEPKSMSRELTFQKDTDNWQVISKTLADLTRDVVSDIRQSGYKTKTVTVKIRFSDFKTITRAKSLHQATDMLEPIRRAAFDALGRGLRGGTQPQKIRLIGVRCSNLQ